MADKMQDGGSQGGGSEAAKAQPTPAETKLADWLKKRADELIRDRFAEEREWFECGLFYQLKQWLERSDDNKRKLRPIRASDKKNFPMPVSDHFSKTVNTNAGFLGSALPRMQALADNYDAKNRRAGEAAEAAIDAANEESGMNILVPRLAKRVMLYGLGVTKDTVAFDHSTDELPEYAEPQAPMQAGQAAMGQPPVAGQAPAGQTGAPAVQTGQPAQPADTSVQAPMVPQQVGTVNIPSPRLDTELPTIFDVYLPRDCKDPNLTPFVLERVTKPKSKWRELYPDTEFTKDDSREGNEDSLAGYYVRSLRSLSTVSQPGTSENVTLMEAWLDWSELGKDEQDAITGEWGETASAMYPQITRAQAAVQYGLFAILWKDELVDWGENPWGNDKNGQSVTPYTFFPYEKDPESAYPKSLATTIKPLQKQLNRYKSLVERQALTNGSARILWPNTQNGPRPTGDPADLIPYDPLGEGKVKPEVIPGNMGDKGIFQMIEMVLADFKDLGYTNEVAEGEMPGAGTAFRALAYLGSKAEESRKPQRYLWEQGHELRARKLLLMAMKVWTNPRKVQTAGFNNKFGAAEIARADLQGDYQLEVIQDSSRPKTLTEKMEVIQQLISSGLVDISKQSTRVYITDTMGVQEIDLADNLQYQKAERDLELLKQGVKPQTNPYTNWSIAFDVMSDYTLTEEYEAAEPTVQQGILAYTQWLQEMMTPPPSALPPGPLPPGAPPPVPPHPGGKQQQHKPNQKQVSQGGPGGEPASHVLGQVPGAQVSPQMVQHAAETEGNAVIPQEVGAN